MNTSHDLDANLFSLLFLLPLEKDDCVRRKFLYVICYMNFWGNLLWSFSLVDLFLPFGYLFPISCQSLCRKSSSSSQIQQQIPMPWPGIYDLISSFDIQCLVCSLDQKYRIAVTAIRDEDGKDKRRRRCNVRRTEFSHNELEPSLHMNLFSLPGSWCSFLSLACYRSILLVYYSCKNDLRGLGEENLRKAE